MTYPGFEDDYLDVLQNIEAVIVQIYRRDAELTDYEVNSAFESLIKTYQGESSGRAVVEPRNPKAKVVYDAVYAVCQFRLGREQLTDKKGEKTFLGIEPLSIEKIILCLKRLRKSAETWTKRSGRQGYLMYIDQFIR